MDYREWDPLQLSSEIDGGVRVVKQSVSFDLFRTYRRKISWNPIAYQNFGIFYGKLIGQKSDIIEAIAKRSNKFHKSVNVSLFTFKNRDNDDKWKDLEKQHTSFFHHQFEETFEFFLQELDRLRFKIEEKSNMNKIIEPSNKVLHLVLLDLGDEEIKSLTKPDNLNLFVKLLTESYYQRIYIGLFMKDAASISQEVHDCLDLSAYLGAINDDYCRSIYKDVDENEYSRRQVLIGTGFIKSSRDLINLHPLKFTPNEEFLKAQKSFDEEDAAYMKFLNGLDDGTVEVE